MLEWRKRRWEGGVAGLTKAWLLVPVPHCTHLSVLGGMASLDLVCIYIHGHFTDGLLKP